MVSIYSLSKSYLLDILVFKKFSKPFTLLCVKIHQKKVVFLVNFYLEKFGEYCSFTIHLSVSYTTVRNMEKTNEQNVYEKIAAYNLLGALQDRLKVKRVGGVARSTIYKAFQVGGTTPSLRLVIDTCIELIEEHENAFKEQPVRA